MVDVTYIDEDGSAPEVDFLGVSFRSGEPVVVEDTEKLRLIRLNRFFVVDESTEEPVKRGPGRPPKAKDEGGE